jgi:hypothetical protein
VDVILSEASYSTLIQRLRWTSRVVHRGVEKSKKDRARLG